MATKPINKWPLLKEGYGGPTLYLTDVVNPDAVSGFSTRSAPPEQFLHFELLTPNQTVTKGAVLPVPTVPLNFIIRNAYVTFTSMTNSAAANIASRSLIQQILFDNGMNSDDADALTNNIFLDIGDIPYSDGVDSYGRAHPNPYEGALDGILYYSLDALPKEKKDIVLPLIKAALTLATVSLKFGLMDLFDRVTWDSTTIQPAGLSIEGGITNYMLPNSSPLGIQITDFLAIQPGVELNGLTLWLRGYFQVPYSPLRTNQAP